MSKVKLLKQLERFASLASIVSPLCSKYNNSSVKPFLESAQIYSENFRSSTEFTSLLQAHQRFMMGSVSICNRLFDNYEASKQNSIYDWSKHFFNLLAAAKRVIDDAYNLAYTVGRTDPTTKTIIEKEDNPLVQIQRKVILEEGEYDAVKKSMFDWKCGIQALYVEEQYMKHIVEMCNSRKTKFNPNEAQLNTCTLRKTMTIPENSYAGRTPTICVLNAELINGKMRIETHEKNGSLAVDDIDNYLAVYNRYQRELIAFVFANFAQLYNEPCVQCIKIFLEQQHSIVFNLLQRRKKLVNAAVEKRDEDMRHDHIVWNDIDKSRLAEGTCDSNSSACFGPTKVVGSLQ